MFIDYFKIFFIISFKQISFTFALTYVFKFPPFNFKAMARTTSVKIVQIFHVYSTLTGIVCRFMRRERGWGRWSVSGAKRGISHIQAPTTFEQVEDG